MTGKRCRTVLAAVAALMMMPRAAQADEIADLQAQLSNLNARLDHWAKNANDGLSMYGITIYGTVDLGLSYQSHGSPFSDAAATNVNNFLIKSSNNPNLSLASNGMSISTIGIKGRESLVEGWWGIFQADTGFLPASGTLIDGPGSIAHNNGVALAQQGSYGDSTRAGQAFNGRVNLGIESARFGTLTIGRNSTTLNDAIRDYDPLGSSLQFSYMGFFGATAGGGDTEDRLLDDTIKYNLTYGHLHGGALYQFGGLTAAAGQKGNAYQFDLGASYGGLSVDAVLARKRDAVLVSAPLTTAQVAALTTPGSPEFGLSVDTTVPATVSDNASYTIAARYDFGRPKLYFGYEHIRYDNPSTPLAVGTEIIGGYRIIPNNSAFPDPKVLQIVWGGAQFALTPSIDLLGGYYRAIQSSYAATACSDTSSGQCSGHYDAASLVLDKRFNHYFDVYGGVQWSEAFDGMASGYLHSASFDPMIGGRFTF